MKHFILSLVALTVMGSQCAVGQNQVKRLSAETVKLDVSKMTDAGQTVRLSRYLFAGYNTLCLPMTLSAEQLAATAKDIKVERLAAIRQEGNTVQLLFVDCTNEGIEAGMPYLIFSPTRQYLRAKNTDAYDIDTEVKTVRMTDNRGNQVSFASSWNIRQKDGLYGIPAKQNVEILESVLVRTTEELSILPTRCSFSWEQQAPSAEKLEIIHTNLADVTAIDQQLKAKSINDEKFYDLNGRHVNAPAKGIYIKGGKKIVK